MKCYFQKQYVILRNMNPRVLRKKEIIIAWFLSIAAWSELVYHFKSKYEWALLLAFKYVLQVSYDSPCC